MNHPLQALFRQAEEQEPKHALSQEAQSANLLSAWVGYTAPKQFEPGDLVREQRGLGVFPDRTLVLLFVRRLVLGDPFDELLIKEIGAKAYWNKIDCIIARRTDDGSVVFMPMDSDILEKLDGGASC